MSEPMTNEEYVTRKGQRCPSCRGAVLDDRYAGDFNNAGAGYKTIRCIDCGAEWEETYTLAGYSALEIKQ